MKTYYKYLAALLVLVILLGVGMIFFPSNIIPMAMIVAWVLIVAGIIATGERIFGRLSRRAPE